MEDKPKTSKPRHNKTQSDRPTIGFLTHEIWGTFGDLLWQGIIDAVKKEDANLICFPGGNLKAEQKAQANVVYDLVSAHTVDGLVISGSTLTNFIELEDFKTFCERYRPLPIVNIAVALEGIPAVLVDNYQGLRDVVTHLVEVHGCRRLAFIPGPPDNAEAQERYRAYTDGLRDYGLPFDPDLVAPPGDWFSPSARHAIHVLLDQREVQFDAVITANDRMAIGALEALQAQGMVVPDDVIVTGFDDSEEAWFLMPPLTTVRQPMHEQLKQATKMVLAQLHGEQVPEQVTIPMELVVRQSCGCLDPKVMQTVATPVMAADGPFKEVLLARRDEIVREMSHAVAAHSSHLPAGWAAHLLDEFAAGIEKKSVDGFLLALDKVLRRVIAVGSDVADWHEVLAVLRRHALPYLSHAELLWAEDLWQKAGVMIGKMTKRIEMHQVWQKTEQARLLGNTEADLITTFDVTRLMDVLAERLPPLGVPSCYLSLYEDAALPGDWARLILAYQEHERVTVETDGLRFPSRHLVPERFWPRERRYHLVVEPLYFQDNQLGFVVFELGPRDGNVYEMLRRVLSSALQGAFLLQERQRVEEALEKAYARVEKQVAERTAELRREIAERERAQEENLRLQQEVIEAQKQAIQELSTPVIPVLEGIIVMPLIGSIDTLRARDITRRLLAGIREHRAKVVILDITGVPLVDSGVAAYLNRTVQAARLKGTRTIVTGISGAVAETIVDLGIDWSGIETLSNLQTGLRVVLTKMRRRIE